MGSLIFTRLAKIDAKSFVFWFPPVFFRQDALYGYAEVWQWFQIQAWILRYNKKIRHYSKIPWHPIFPCPEFSTLVPDLQTILLIFLHLFRIYRIYILKEDFVKPSEKKSSI